MTGTAVTWSSSDETFGVLQTPLRETEFSEGSQRLGVHRRRRVPSAHQGAAQLLLSAAPAIANGLTMLVILVIGIVVDSLFFGRLDAAIRRRWGLAS